MIFNQANKRAGQASARGGKRRLYSVPVWLEQRAFTGSFDLAGASYKLAFIASRAEIINKQLQLSGRLTVTDPRGRTRSVDLVRATYAAIQGGIGSPPARRRGVAAGAQATALPRTEFTGPTSFCGVMYLHLEPLNARSLGVAADLSRVQLNARFAPKDGTAKTLHSLYASLVDAVYGEQAGEAEAATIVDELNKVLRS